MLLFKENILKKFKKLKIRFSNQFNNRSHLKKQFCPAKWIKPFDNWHQIQICFGYQDGSLN